MKGDNNYIFVANWKMSQSPQKALSFLRSNHEEWKKITEKNIPIVICPSFPSIPLIVQDAIELDLYVGAQTCSSFAQGAYTGDVSATDLAEIGCSFCIVGHSERRSYFSEKDKDIVLKVEQLLENKIIPIVCIGETQEENKENKTEEKLLKQLKQIIKLLSSKQHKEKPVCIAYEPIWAIGTGEAPTKKYLEKKISWIQNILRKKEIKNVAILYGGSINENNITTLKTIPGIDGFLIGGASQDFKELKKIVLS